MTSGCIGIPEVWFLCSWQPFEVIKATDLYENVQRLCKEQGTTPSKLALECGFADYLLGNTDNSRSHKNKEELSLAVRELVNFISDLSEVTVKKPK